MDKEQTTGADKPFDMADFVAEVLDDPKAADRYREHARATQLIDKLVFMRVRRGVTQRDMARIIGVSQSKIFRFEDKPDADLDLGMLGLYANALGLRMSVSFTDEKQGDAARIKASVFLIHRQLRNLTDIARRNPDDKALCDGIAQFQAEVLLNFLDKYGESADMPRVFDYMAGRFAAELEKDAPAAPVPKGKRADEAACAAAGR